MLQEMQHGAALKDQTVRVPWWQERLLLAAMLLALLSAVVPALFPSGSPMSRLPGSAFDPTTSTVTLRVRSQSDRYVVPPTDQGSGERRPQMPPALLPAATSDIVSAAHAAPIAFAPDLPAPPAGPRRAGISLARAPPHVLT